MPRTAAARLRDSLICAFGIRLMLLVVMAASIALLALHTQPWPRDIVPPEGFLGRVVQPWAGWDGLWYLGIADHGYARFGSPAFFPLYPLLVRGATPLLGGNAVIAGVVLSLVLYGLAIWVLYKLVAADFSPAVAQWTTVFLAVFPTSFFFQAVYAESLFLLLSVVCFYWSRQGRWALAGLAGFAAALTRSTGLLLLIPMAIYYLQARDWKLKRLDRSAAWLLLVPGGLLAYMAYLATSFGDPLLFSQAQIYWRRTFAFPLQTLYAGLVESPQRLYRLIVTHGVDTYGSAEYLAFGVVVLAIVLIVLGWRRLPPSYTAYAVASLVVPLCFPRPDLPFLSFPRFALVIFPLFVTLALVTQHRRWLRGTLLGVMGAMLVALTVVFAVAFVA